MSPGFAVLVLMNNYFHDVATAMLLACAIAMRTITANLENNRDREVLAYFTRLYRGVKSLAAICVVWIVLGGIPRILTFRSFEWTNAVAKNHEAGLIAKYVIAVCMMAVGAYLWRMQIKKPKKMGFKL